MVGEFSVTRKAVDALGLIICGGQSRDQHVKIQLNTVVFILLYRT